MPFIALHDWKEVEQLKTVAAASNNPDECTLRLLRINVEYWQLVQTRDDEDKRHRLRCEEIDRQISKLQKSCPHPDGLSERWGYGYDSGNECKVCGADNVRSGVKPLDPPEPLKTDYVI
jgi:hypothetical protein